MQNRKISSRRDIMKNSLPVFILIAFFTAGCSVQGKNKSENVSIICWNVQTFFDGNDDGIEYRDFRNSAGWNEDLYLTRLERLCRFIKTNEADIYVFTEVENEKIVYDISNFLSEQSLQPSKRLDYAAFCKNEDSAIGCAVISRYPLSDIKQHSLDIRTENSKMPSMRPIMELTVDTGNKSLTLFVNHWKSKYGGAKKTEVWRNAQESLLSELIKNRLENDCAIIACGDFNRDITEFICTDDTVNLRGEDFDVPVTSAWLLPPGDYETGSYYFNGKWEKIDHFFAAGKAIISDFKPMIAGEWAASNGIPKSYRIYSKSGWSDHLPIKCTVEFR